MDQTIRFGAFTLDPANRRLTRDGEVVELSSRYLDALALLVGSPGDLVSKDRFMDAVWRGVPVTDEALTQCIRALRRALGDDAANPRFIETVPKHGYRFIAAMGGTQAPAPARAPTLHWPDKVLLAAAGTVGGGAAGAIGGVIYGFLGASLPGTGAASVLMVLLCVTILVGLTGAVGVASGIALSGFGAARPGPWVAGGGAAGGLAIGAVMKLIGMDALALLTGATPAGITGAPEGLALGSAVGVAAWLGVTGRFGLRQTMAIAGALGGLAGAGIVLAGGRLLAGSLDLLAREFPASRLRLDGFGALVGEAGLGPVSHTVSAAAEGALFASCVVGAMLLARRQLAG
jgi:DNA-binding winged helix-turn-helix (wHTH) protein